MMADHTSVMWLAPPCEKVLFMICSNILALFSRATSFLRGYWLF
jgi:hypothetical protein